MPRAVTCLLAAAAVAAGGWYGAGAVAFTGEPLNTPITGDLDGDGTDEAVRLHETACFESDEAPPPCAPDTLRSIFVEVVDDSCATGPTTLKLSREMEGVSIGDIIDADRDGQKRELIYELRAGASGRGVQAKIVRFRAGPGGCVQVAKTLFSYPQPATIGRRPKGTSFSSGSLVLGDFDKARSGFELRTDETYGRPSDPGCCPRYARTTYWRFITATSSYKSYRTKLKRVPRP